MEKRIVIRNNIRWTRFILIPIMFFILIEIIFVGENRALNFIFLFGCIALFRLLYSLRRLHYDSTNLYIINGKKEKTIPFTSIISIKRSRTKVNGSRYWILIYQDASGKKHKCRYFNSLIPGDSSEFHKRVRLANPDLVYWSHPFFNH